MSRYHVKCKIALLLLNKYALTKLHSYIQVNACSKQ